MLVHDWYKILTIVWPHRILSRVFSTVPIEVEVHLIASRNIKTSTQKQIQSVHAEQLFDSIYPTYNEFWRKEGGGGGERERVLIICCALIKTSAIRRNQETKTKNDMVKSRFDWASKEK